jgi:hypothetical protein
MKSTNLVFAGLFILLELGIGHAQSETDVIKYFETKGRPSVYFAPSAIKDNKVLQAKLLTIDNSVIGYFKNFVKAANKGDSTFTIQGTKDPSTLRQIKIQKAEFAHPTERQAAQENVREKSLNKKLSRKITQQPEVDTTQQIIQFLEPRLTSQMIQAIALQTSKDTVHQPTKAMGIHYDFDLKESYLYDLKSGIKIEDTNENIKSKNTVFFAGYNITDNMTMNFIADSCFEEIKNGKIYIENGIDLCKIEFPSSTSPCAGPAKLEALDEDIKKKIGAIDTSKVKINEFIFIDTFDSSKSVPHGKKVRQIIDYTLEHFNARQLIPKVKGIPLDFFDPKINSVGLVKNYLKKFDQSFQEILDKKLEYYKHINKSQCSDFCMPSDYLYILLDSQLMKSPEVISMSFFIKTFFPSIIFSIKPNMYTNLLGAVKNQGGAIENLDTDFTGTKHEPIFTLKSNILSTGTMLIGAKSGSSENESLYSEKGVNVSSLGNGCWTKSFYNAPTDWGTSWATPEVATKLFIAKAYWKSIGSLEINALEAKHRLMLSTDLEYPYVGKYASAGIPNMNKLLRGENEGFMEMKDSTYDISLQPNPKIHFYQEDEDEMILILKKRPNPKNNYIRGLYYKNNTFYYYQETSMKWEEVKDWNSVGFAKFKVTYIDKNNIKKEITIKNLESIITNQITQIVRL